MSFEAFGEHFAIELPGARAVFSTRRGGASAPPYDTLNLGRGTDDDPAAVEANRLRLARLVGVELAGGRQVHGSAVAVIERATDTDGLEADGFATRTPGVAPMVLAADCLPIAIAGGGAVAMLHAGWGGLAKGVIGVGVRTVRELGSGGPLAAAIGPGAGPCCYEVGEELHERFAAYGPEVRRGRMLDLKLIARRQLEVAGVARVEDAGLCTICAPASMFFSHRREHGVTGRQAGVAWLT